MKRQVNSSHTHIHLFFLNTPDTYSHAGAWSRGRPPRGEANGVLFFRIIKLRPGPKTELRKDVGSNPPEALAATLAPSVGLISSNGVILFSTTKHICLWPSLRHNLKSNGYNHKLNKHSHPSHAHVLYPIIHGFCYNPYPRLK